LNLAAHATSMTPLASVSSKSSAPDIRTSESGHGVNKVPNERAAIGVAMPGERDVPFRLGHPQFLKANTRQTHHRRRAWHERHTEPCPYERHDRKQLEGFLHHARRETGGRADVQHVIVEARRA
jgi:hypothetical protein